MLEQHAEEPADPVNPQRVFHELSPRLPDDCILTGDSGSPRSGTRATSLPPRDARRALRHAGDDGLGGALRARGEVRLPGPAGDRRVGDGAMQMSGINALIDVAKHWRRWSDPRLIVLVLNNRDLN